MYDGTKNKTLTMTETGLWIIRISIIDNFDQLFAGKSWSGMHNLSMSFALSSSPFWFLKKYVSDLSEIWEIYDTLIILPNNFKLEIKIKEKRNNKCK